MMYLGTIIWNVSGRWPWVGDLSLAMVCIAISIYIYARQPRTLPWFWWSVMLLLRMVALVAICLSLLQPMAVRPDHSDAGGVAILIDRSRSMNAVDTGATPAEQVATAAALNFFPAPLRDSSAIALQDAAARLNPLLDETRRLFSERQYAALTDASTRALSVPFLDLQRRWRIAMSPLDHEPAAASLVDLTHHFDQPGWSDQMQKKIDELRANLAARQRENDARLYSHNTTVRQACDEVIAMTRLERERAAVAGVIAQVPASVPIYAAFFDSTLTPTILRNKGNAVWPVNPSPRAEQSDISGSIRQLLERMGDNRLQAILLFTDGRQVGGTLGAVAGETSPPVFPILSAGTPRDLVLSKITGLKRAYLHEPIAIAARIRAANLADIPVQLDLRMGNHTEKEIVRLDHDGMATARLRVPLLHGGEQSISLQLAPIAGEASAENNRAELHVSVEPRRMKLALLASFPTRDFQFLREQLQQTAWIDSTVILPRQRISPEDLRKQDVIVLDDLAARQLDASQWSAIHDASERNGAGLILIAGGNHLPNEYLNDPHRMAFLPFDVAAGPPVWRTWAGADAYFRFIPVDIEAPLLRLEDDVDVMRQWDRLPAVYHYLQMPALRPTVQRLLLERESGSPVLTEMPLGRGRVILVGFNETWRWRSESVSMQQRFWLQLLRHAAELSDSVQDQGQTSELADLSPEHSLLSRLSATRDVYSLADVPRIWQIMQHYQQTHPRVSEYALWHSPWLFALILGCFGAEWALRKRFGLA